MGMAGTSPHDRGVPTAIPINCLHAFLLSWQRTVQNSAPPSSGYPNPQKPPPDPLHRGLSHCVRGISASRGHGRA